MPASKYGKIILSARNDRGIQGEIMERKMKFRAFAAALAAGVICAAAVPAKSVSAVTTTRVTGTAVKGTEANMLYLQTTQGTMVIELDKGTAFTGCSGISVGKSLTADVYRGQNAYMHATLVTDAANGASAGNSASGTPVQPEKAGTAATSSVYGKINKESTSDLLKLDTQGGQMLIRIDSGCQVEGSRLLLPGREITVYVYRGQDAYMHTNRITNEKKVVRITVDRSRTYTVSGTIEPDSTETTLNFKTDQGNMTIKLDEDTAVSGGGVIWPGQKAVITAARGSDAFLHAVSIEPAADSKNSAGGLRVIDNSLQTAATLDMRSAFTVSGTIVSGTTSNLVKLSTSSGTMLIKIDNTTDVSKISALVVGRTAQIRCARGSDAYLHALSIQY